jgi:ubiquinone/menaquinone biosynthesis C-methylase UbiE
MDEFAHIAKIMRDHGATCSVEDFHSKVNLAFHKYESEVYDQLHQDMWVSLPEQFQLLVNDYIATKPALSGSLNVLDVGCGTGLASCCLLKTQLKRNICSVDFLDTSPFMLQRASERAKSWNLPYRCIEGRLDELGGDTTYGIIVVCSVLHHIPDLSAFLLAVQRIQKTGGIFIHLQDPNGDYLADPELNARMKEVESELSPPTNRFTMRRILGRLYREVSGKQGKDYISKTNRELLASGAIKYKLSIPELFSITDIHVNDGQGISMSELRELLPGYQLAAHRSYGFQGKLAGALPDRLRSLEEKLIAARALNGFHLGALWKKDGTHPHLG